MSQFIAMYDEQTCGCFNINKITGGCKHSPDTINMQYMVKIYPLYTEHRFGRMLSLLHCTLLVLLLRARRHPSAIQQAVNVGDSLVLPITMPATQLNSTTRSSCAIGTGRNYQMYHDKRENHFAYLCTAT